MPVILPVVLLLGSLVGLFIIVGRRFKIFQKTVKLQKELEKHQKKLKRAEKQEKRVKDKALKELKRAADQKHKALRNLGAISDLMSRVEHDLVKGDRESALKTLIQVISLDESHRKGNELMAQIYLDTGRHKKAELIYKHLIEQHPFSADYYANLGHCYFQRRQFKAATTFYEKALELDKNNPSRYRNLGHVYSTRRDYAKALEYYLKAHRLNVRDVELMFLIVEICLQNSDPISARQYLHKILDYEPYNQQAKSLLGEVLRDLKEEV